MRVPLAVPNLDGNEADYLQECVRSTFVSTAGPFVGRFEEHLARVSGTPSAVVLCSGTVALQLALESSGVTRGDLVMVPSLTFIASPNSVRHTGADVWLVDCDPTDWTFDVDLARSVIESETEPHPRGRRHVASGKILTAVMPVMIMGATLDFDALVALGRDYGLKVVVDAAAAIGATGCRGEPLGSTGVDAVCYSFNGNKTITSGGGGAVVSQHPELIERIKHVSTTARLGTDYEHDVVGYNFRMTNVEAAIGVAQIERLDEFLDRKRQVFERYEALAALHPHLQPFPTPERGRSVHWFSGVVYSGPDPSATAAFRSFMQERGVDVRPFWKPIHLQIPYRESLSTAMPVCEPLWERIVPLPCSTGITDAELDYVVGAATTFWNEHDRAADG